MFSICNHQDNLQILINVLLKVTIVLLLIFKLISYNICAYHKLIGSACDTCDTANTLEALALRLVCMMLIWVPIVFD